MNDELLDYDSVRKQLLKVDSNLTEESILIIWNKINLGITVNISDLKYKECSENDK